MRKAILIVCFVALAFVGGWSMGRYSRDRVPGSEPIDSEFLVTSVAPVKFTLGHNDGKPVAEGTIYSPKYGTVAILRLSYRDLPK
jgi:hypothetical protein